MLGVERHEAIAARVQTEGRVLVTELANAFSITQETVRRDLDALESQGVLRRVHGGAVAVNRLSLSETDLGERTATNREGKRAIARLAVDRLIALGPTSVFLDAGSTTGAFAAALAEHWGRTHTERLLVATHSPAIAHTLAANPVIEVHQIGGRIRGVTSSAVGAHTVRAIDALRPDLAVIGANGVTIDGVVTPDPEEAEVKAQIVASGRRVALLADHTKFDVDSLCRFAALDALDAFVTDAPPSAGLARALTDARCETSIA